MRETKSIVKVCSIFVVKFFEFFVPFISSLFVNFIIFKSDKKTTQLPHVSEYNMTNIFRVSHILPTYFKI